MQTVLVTGGTGFIGSHTVVELLNSGYNIVIVDNLYNSKRDIIDHILGITKVNPDRVKFYEVDLVNLSAIEEVFKKEKIDFIIHFAALKAVGESVKKPVEYYSNNLIGLLNLLQLMKKYQVLKIIFSSSATVYGNPEVIPVTEETPLQEPLNPYGKTKVMIEKILTDFAKAEEKASVILLRYFNPAGAHPSGELGEDPLGIPHNLMPILTRVLVGKMPSMKVFGKDYETRDGTCIRDYIHVVDLAKGHVAALKVINEPGVKIYNLGRGSGYTVLEIINAIEKASGKKLNYEIGERREGDITAIYADCSKAERELGWKATLTIEDMCRDAWNFQSKYPNGI